MIPFPKKRYQIIYADPPWKYVHWNDDKVTRKAPYPLMTTDEIFDLPVQDIADDTSRSFEEWSDIVLTQKMIESFEQEFKLIYGKEKK